MSALVPGLTGGINEKKNKYVAVFRFCDILILFGTLSMSFRMCGLALMGPITNESNEEFVSHIRIHTY